MLDKFNRGGTPGQSPGVARIFRCMHVYIYIYIPTICTMLIDDPEKKKH